MNRDEYRAVTRELSDQAHAMHNQINKALDGLEAGCQEWTHLHILMQLIGTVSSIIHLERYPRETGLRDHEWITNIPMVCTACRQPVKDRGTADGTCFWAHIEATDDTRCPALRAARPVKAMVAAGNGNIPADA